METRLSRTLTRRLASGGIALAVAAACALTTLAASAAEDEQGAERQWRAQERAQRSERRQETQQAIEQGTQRRDEEWARRQGAQGNDPESYRPDYPPPRDRGADPRPGRLTPEERRALRRQIYEGGREVYRPPERR